MNPYNKAYVPGLNLRSKLVVTSLLICFLSGCTSKPEPPLYVASINWLGYQPLFYAEELKFFDKKDISLKKLGSASEVIRSFRNNIIDAATLTLDESILLSQTTDDFEIILIMDISYGADAIVAKEPIRKFSDLKSKVIGVEKTALGAYMLTRALELSNIDNSEIKTRFIEYNRHQSAFTNNEVDAIVTFDPVKTILQQAGGNVLFDSRNIPDEIIDVLIVRRSLSELKRKKVQLLVNSWFKTLNYINRNRTNADKSLAKLNNLSLAGYRTARTQIRVPSIDKNLRLFSGKKTGILPRLEKVKEVLKIENSNPDKPLRNTNYLINAQ